MFVLLFFVMFLFLFLVASDLKRCLCGMNQSDKIKTLRVSAACHYTARQDKDRKEKEKYLKIVTFDKIQVYQIVYSLAAN